MGMENLKRAEEGRSSQSLFAGLKICIDKRGLAAKRRRILEDMIRKHQGELVSEGDGGRGETIILADPQGESSTNDAERVYSVDWVSSSVEQGRRLELADFRLTKPQRRPRHAAVRRGMAKRLADATRSLLAPDYLNTTYDCQRKTPLHGPNDELVRLLEKIARHRYLTGNDRSALSYRRAISALRAYPRKLASAEEARAIKSIGDKISMMVGEYLQRGMISEVERVERDVEAKGLGELTRVHGVGPKAAATLMGQGISSIAELREAVAAGKTRLSHEQAIGLKYVEDFEQP